MSYSRHRTTSWNGLECASTSMSRWIVMEFSIIFAHESFTYKPIAQLPMTRGSWETRAATPREWKSNSMNSSVLHNIPHWIVSSIRRPGTRPYAVDIHAGLS
ncbi:hypothetical protein DPSP01_013375 [Paraphaeosphaeria sporulosa]